MTGTPRHKAGMRPPTLEDVEVMLAQVDRDKDTAYWGDQAGREALGYVEAWLRSLGDWIKAQ